MARLNGCMIDQRWKSDDDDTIAVPLAIAIAVAQELYAY